MIKLIASDLDGTIINDFNSIPEDNIKATKLLKDKHIPLVICTGKTYALCSDFCKTLQADFGIFGNGNQIIDLSNSMEIARNILSFLDIQSCFLVSNKYNLHVHIYTEDSIVTPCPLYMDLRNSTLLPDTLKLNVVSSVFDYINNEKCSVFKLIISSTSSLAMVKEELEKNTSLNITHILKTGIYRDNIIDKEYEYLDISPAKCSKGHALTTLSKYLNLNTQDILSIGDNLNDIDMFNVSNFSVAVNNAHDLVKKSANYITHNSASDGGFAEAIYKFIPF